MITINSQLDMTPGAIPVVIHRSQYDSDFSIVFTLFARMGNFTIASGTTAKVRGTKKSGTGYSADATVNVSAKTVTVTGDQQMTVASGQNIFEIVLLSGTKELCSANFILDVECAALDMDTITDDTVARELDNLDQFVNEAESAATRAEQAAASIATDTTLTVSGKPADAKAVGDAIANEDKKALAAFATDIASGSVASFPDGADSIPMKDVLVHIEPVQAGSGDPSPDNVRPITGWTGAKVTRTGKNLLNPTLASKTNTGLTATKQSDNSYRVIGTANATDVNIWLEGQYITDAATQLDAFKIIFLKAGTIITYKDCKLFFYDIETRKANTTFGINQVPLGSAAVTLTIPRDSWLTGVRIPDAVNGETYDMTVYPQLELGSIATNYEPYQGDTYDITFPSEAGTVYGGTLDVTSGVLTVDSVVRDMGSEKWVYNSTYDLFVDNGDQMKSYGTWICEIYPYKGIYLAMSDKSCGYIFISRLAVKDSSFNRDIDAFKSAMNGVKAVTPLAEPITYTLTPQEITSLLGTNNLWADTGDSDVEYRANTKVYVDAKVAAAESNITSLQNSKVDKTTPLLNFDDTATDPLTDDGALANALTALGILSDVIQTGGGMLYLKKLLTGLTNHSAFGSTEKVTIDTSSLPSGVSYVGGTVTAIRSADGKTVILNGELRFNITAGVTSSNLLIPTSVYLPARQSVLDLVCGYVQSFTWNSSTSQLNLMQGFLVRIDTTGRVSFYMPSIYNNSGVLTRLFVPLQSVILTDSM